MEGLGENPYCKYLVFMSCTRYYPPDDGTEYHAKDAMTYVKGHTALGGGNMALFGTGSLHTWASDLYEVTERFTDQRIIDGRKFFDDSCGRFVKFSLSNFIFVASKSVRRRGEFRTLSIMECFAKIDYG